MARCGCATDCLCTLIDGDCTQAVGSGTIASPYAVNVTISADPDNIITCEADGLLVTPNLTTEDSDCITLSGIGSVSDPLVAEIVPDPDVCNLLDCTATGLGAFLTTADSDCIIFTGCGSAVDPLIAEPVISIQAGNVLVCRTAGEGNPGLYAPASTQAAVDCRATLLHVGFLPTVMPPAALGVPSTQFIDYDVTEEVIGVAVFPGGGGAFANTTIEIPDPSCNGVYLIQATHPAWSTPPGNTTSDVIVRLRLYRNLEGIGQTAQFKRTSGGQTIDFNTPYLHISRTLPLVSGDAISVEFVVENYGAAFPGATLDLGPTYGVGAAPPAGEGRPFFQITRIGTL